MLSSTLAPPACPTPVETIADALDHVGPLNGLPLEDRLWLARHGQEVVAKSGDVLYEEGAPAEDMVLILKGEIHVRRQHGGPMALFIGRTGQMTGLLPFSRMKVSGGQGYAISDVWGLLIHKSLFAEMLQAIPSMAQRVVATLLDRVREVTRIEQQARLRRPARRLRPHHRTARQPRESLQAGQPVHERGAGPRDRVLGAENL